MTPEGQEPSEFWTALGGKGPYSSDKRFQVGLKWELKITYKSQLETPPKENDQNSYVSEVELKE